MIYWDPLLTTHCMLHYTMLIACLLKINDAARELATMKRKRRGARKRKKRKEKNFPQPSTR